MYGEVRCLIAAHYETGQFGPAIPIEIPSDASPDDFKAMKAKISE